MINSESVRIATPATGEKSLKRLEDLLAKMKKASVEDNSKAFSEYDLKYHMTIVKMTGNPMMIKAYKILLNVLTESMDYVIEKMKYKPALDYHRKIPDARKKKDADPAERLMREHIRQNYAYFQEGNRDET